MGLVLVSVLMDLLLGLLSRAVILLSAGALLTGTWARACWGWLALQEWLGEESCTSFYWVLTLK